MTDIITSLEHDFEIVKTDVEGFVSAVVKDLEYVGHEAELGIAWIDKSVPGAQQAFATFFQVADVAAQATLTASTGGLGSLASAAIDGAGSYLANLLSKAGIDMTAKTALSQADAAAILATHTIAQNAQSVALAKLLGGLGSIYAAAQTANAQTAATAAA